MFVTFYLLASHCMLIYIWILEWFDSSSLKPDPNETVDMRSLRAYSIEHLVYYVVGLPVIIFPFPSYDCNCYNDGLGVIQCKALLPSLQLVWQ